MDEQFSDILLHIGSWFEIDLSALPLTYDEVDFAIPTTLQSSMYQSQIAVHPEEAFDYSNTTHKSKSFDSSHPIYNSSKSATQPKETFDYSHTTHDSKDQIPTRRKRQHKRTRKSTMEKLPIVDGWVRGEDLPWSITEHVPDCESTSLPVSNQTSDSTPSQDLSYPTSTADPYTTYNCCDAEPSVSYSTSATISYDSTSYHICPTASAYTDHQISIWEEDVLRGNAPCDLQETSDCYKDTSHRALQDVGAMEYDTFSSLKVRDGNGHKERRE